MDKEFLFVILSFRNLIQKWKLLFQVKLYLKLVKFITEHIAYRRVIFCELLFER